LLNYSYKQGLESRATGSLSLNKKGIIFMTETQTPKKEKILFSDLKEIKLNDNSDNIGEAIKFLMKLSKAIGDDFNYKDILIQLGFSAGKYSKAIEDLALYYVVSSEEIQKKILESNDTISDSILKEAAENAQKRQERFQNIPGKLISAFFLSDKEIREDLYLLINLLTDEDINKIRNSNPLVLIDILIRLFLDYQEAFETSFLLKTFLAPLRKILSSVLPTNKEE
jgi:hypothetical protein